MARKSFVLTVSLPLNLITVSKLRISLHRFLPFLRHILDPPLELFNSSILFIKKNNLHGTKLFEVEKKKLRRQGNNESRRFRQTSVFDTKNIGINAFPLL